jgi:hypothetical protein
MVIEATAKPSGLFSEEGTTITNIRANHDIETHAQGRAFVLTSTSYKQA